jgi:hypothetical protein
MAAVPDLARPAASFMTTAVGTTCGAFRANAAHHRALAEDLRERRNGQGRTVLKFQPDAEDGS